LINLVYSWSAKQRNFAEFGMILHKRYGVSNNFLGWFWIYFRITADFLHKHFIMFFVVSFLNKGKDFFAIWFLVNRRLQIVIFYSDRKNNLNAVFLDL
jgi:hypothetical protein